MTTDDRADWGPGAWPLCGIGPREALPPHVTWPSRRDPRGVDGPTDWQTRSGAWRRAGHNLWVPAGIETTPGQRIVEAAAALPADAAITGWAALHAAGARWFTGERPFGTPLPVPVATGVEHSMRSRPGIAVSQEGLTPQDVTRSSGLRVTTPVRSVAFEMRKAPSDEEAVVAFEMAAYDDLISIEELAEFTSARLWTRQGVERVRRLLPHLEENSWSPTEVVMRLTWIAAGHSRPLANRAVFDRSGRWIGTPDLIDQDAGVYGQYDGVLHLLGAQRSRDVQQEAAYKGVGLEPVLMLAGDLGDRSAFERRLHDAYDRAALVPPERRLWTLTPPAWWTSTHTVARRRSLTGTMRDRLLRYRRVS